MSHALLEELFSLTGKVALVTGGYRGIGLTLAETFAACGASVALAARDGDGCRVQAERIAGQYGVGARGYALDVSDAAAVGRVVETVASDFAHIDILVNCAGISGRTAAATELTAEDVDRVMNINFRGTFLVSQAVARVMIPQGGGRIINIASMLGRNAARYMLSYCSSKAAVIQMSRVMALELMRNNIQVNVVNPGYFTTDINRDFLASEAGKKLLRTIPAGRAGELDELRSVALMLATATPFMTGGEYLVDGGQSLV